jgi:hypothetical protein
VGWITIATDDALRARLHEWAEQNKYDLELISLLGYSARAQAALAASANATGCQVLDHLSCDKMWLSDEPVALCPHHCKQYLASNGATAGSKSSCC